MQMRVVQINRVTLVLLFVGCLALAALVSPLAAQAPAPDSETAERNPPRRVAIRFLTNSDFPPFNYFDEDNTLTGFNVDMARAICLELDAACDIQVRPWEALLPALAKG
ncbi:MAG: transporter substrate-binding domain-containing protein, partial [Rhodospirillales bacterium]|nr:transporter substrate-binding domain-containing protein [Rhodospirillales bacterium]